MVLSIESILRIQFQKARSRGYATNFKLARDTDLPCFPEKTFVRIDATDNTFYFLTESRIMHQEKDATKEVVPYDDIVSSHWISVDEKKAPELKRLGKRDKLVLITKDEVKLVLDNLGDSYQPLNEALQWYLRSRRSNQ